MDAVSAAQDMPEVPEALAVPRSLGGLLNHMHDATPSTPSTEASLGGLMERTSELTEDINERAEVASKVAEAEQHDNSATPVEEESRVEAEKQ